MPQTARGLVVLALLALGSFSPPVSAAPEARAGDILVWSGASDRKAAEAQLAAAQPLFDALSTFVELSPAVVESARVKGLKPGFFVVALGVCSAHELAWAKGLFGALRPPVYSKPVEYIMQGDAPLPCPKPVEVDAPDAMREVRWEAGPVQTIAVDEKRRLVALTFSYRWDQPGDFAQAFFETRPVFALLDTDGRALAAEAPPSASDAQEATLVLRGPSFVVEEKYADPRCEPGGDHYVAWTRTTVARVKGPTLDVEVAEPVKKDEGSCGYAEEEALLTGGPPGGDEGDAP